MLKNGYVNRKWQAEKTKPPAGQLADKGQCLSGTPAGRVCTSRAR